VRENSRAYDKSSVFPVETKPALSGVEWVSAAKYLVSKTGDAGPRDRRNQAVGIQMEYESSMLPAVNPLITRSFSIPSKTNVAQM